MFKSFKNSQNAARIERLRSLSLFVNLTHAELKIIDGLLHERHFVKDEVIFDKGDEGQAIYIIIDLYHHRWQGVNPATGKAWRWCCH